MSSNQYENSIKLAEKTQNELEKVFKEQLKANEVDIEIEFGAKLGEHFVGAVYRATGRAKSNENDDEKSKQMNLFVKVAPQEFVLIEEPQTQACFTREIEMYLDILPMFHKFQVSRGITPEENGFNAYAICYKTIDSGKEKSLIFQDLREFGFQMHDQHAQFSIDHIFLVMQTLGKFHAISFALQVHFEEKMQISRTSN